MKKMNFNEVVDLADLTGYADIIYVDKNGNEIKYEEWSRLSFEELSTKGYFFR
jgi:hypothetical protein